MPFASEFTVKGKFQILTVKIVYAYRVTRWFDASERLSP